MVKDLAHLGLYSDWVDAAKRQAELYPVAPPGEATRRRIHDMLGFTGLAPVAGNTRVEATWERDGLAGEEVTWSVGYGPKTHAWVLKPAGANRPLPGVVALHGHDLVKFFGKEKIADGKDPAPAAVENIRADLYEGRAFANELAGQGFVVLAHDVFLWGSRRFAFEIMPESVHRLVENWRRARKKPALKPTEAERYEVAAQHHEHLVAKYCTLLGTTLAGVVSFEDRVAVRYLQSRPDVRPGPVGCVGLSGGGCRAALLQATCDEIGAAVIVGMMTTHSELLDHQVECHTWMFFPPGLARFADWPDLAASRAPSPLLVQYDLHDELFSIQGMRAAHKRIALHYSQIGRADAYLGKFYDGPHKFDIAMQADAFAWLRTQLQ
jgi:dienelactone hydrolase